MCAPLIPALAIAGVVASVAAAGVGAYASYSQAQAANKAASYNQQVAGYAATQANALGDNEARVHDLQVRQLIGEQKAAYAGGGVVVGGDSPLTVTTQTAGYGALDSLAIKQNRAAQAAGYTNQANLYGGATVNGYGAAGTSLLTSASSVGSSLKSAYNTGAFGSYYPRATLA